MYIPNIKIHTLKCLCVSPLGHDPPTVGLTKRDQTEPNMDHQHSVQAQETSETSSPSEKKHTHTLLNSTFSIYTHTYIQQDPNV